MSFHFSQVRISYHKYGVMMILQMEGQVNSRPQAVTAGSLSWLFWWSSAARSLWRFHSWKWGWLIWFGAEQPHLGLKSSCVCTAAFTVSVLALTNESPWQRVCQEISSCSDILESPSGSQRRESVWCQKQLQPSPPCLRECTFQTENRKVAIKWWMQTC